MEGELHRPFPPLATIYSRKFTGSDQPWPPNQISVLTPLQPPGPEEVVERWSDQKLSADHVQHVSADNMSGGGGGEGGMSST